MSFTGVGGSRRLGIAIGSSIAIHIVAFCLFVSIGGGGGNEKSSEPPPLPPPPAEGEIDGPAPIADAVDNAARIDAERAAAEAAEKEKARNAAKQQAKPKPPAAKKPDPRKEDVRKSEAPVRKPDVKKPDVRKPEAAKSAEEADADADKGEWKAYEVRPGDSLTKIAKKCGVTVQELAKANGLKPTASLGLGQKIKIKASE